MSTPPLLPRQNATTTNSNQTVLPPVKIPASLRSSALSLIPAAANRLAVRRRSGGFLRPDTLAGQFNTLALVAVVTAMLAALVTFFIPNNASEYFKSVVTVSAPNLVAAQNLAVSFSALDIAAARLQVARLNGEDKSSYERARDDFFTQRQSIADTLLEARSNVTSPGEEEAIRDINKRFFEYIALLEVMRHELDQGRRESALAQYKAARDILVGNFGSKAAQSGLSQEELLRKDDWVKLNSNEKYLGIEANIERLAKINETRLNNSSQTINNNLARDFWLLIGAAGLAALMLLILNVRYALVTHRLINPPIAVSLLAALAMLAWLGNTAGSGSGNYAAAALDSVSRVTTADQMKQLLLNLNSDDARLLLSSSANGPNVQPPLAAAEIRQAFDPKLLDEEFKNRYDLLQIRIGKAWQGARSTEERRALCALSDNPNPTPASPLCMQSERSSTFATLEFYSQHNQIMEQFKRGALPEAIRLAAGPSASAVEQFQINATNLARYNQAAFDRTACTAAGKAAFGSTCRDQPGYLNLVRYAGLLIYPLLAILILAGAWFIRRLL